MSSRFFCCAHLIKPLQYLHMEQHDHLYRIRHSSAHLLAMAVRSLFDTPSDVKLGIGPVIDTGFYYDFDLPRPLTDADFAPLEAKMNELIQQNITFTRKPVSREEALELFQDQPYKLELIRDLPEGEAITIYESGDFVDLCKGPHVEHAGEIGSVKLLSLAGAYWRGDEKNKMLQRVYGTAFTTPEALAAYLDQLEEARKRDHRKIGQELDLFTFSDLVGAGLPLFTPKGTVLREQLAHYLNKLQEPLGYERVWIPHITKPELYKVSGHWDKFQDDLFHVKGKNNEAFVLKPMNCPHHNQIYASKPRSYRDLPIRYAEVTTNYRDEQTGELHGLSRVRSLTQDDGHVYCKADQVLDETMAIYRVIKRVYEVFNMPLQIRLSLRDPEHKDNYLGEDAVWEQAEATLKEALATMTEPSFVGIGEAAFYGPKLDFLATDAIGRQWQVATIQLDFNQPQRFNLTYTDADGTEKQVIMVHRAILGSIERFLSVVIEHYAGDFPLWLAPVQVAILPISEKFLRYAHIVEHQLKEKGLRVLIDESNESVGKKIRTAETQKYPIMLIVGEREETNHTVSVRTRAKGDEQQMEGEMTVDQMSNEFNFALPAGLPG